MTGYLKFALLAILTFAVSPVGAARAKAAVVNCNGPNASVQTAVNKANGPTTIFVKGFCTEDVTITKDDITLSGGQGGLACDTASPGGDGTINGTVTIRGVRARIEMLTLTGPGEGLTIEDRAQVDVYCNDISFNEHSGVAVLRDSQANLRHNMVTNNGQVDTAPGSEDPTRFFECGLFAADASSVYSGGNLYSQNSYCGIAADRGSSFRNGSFVPSRAGFAADPDEKDVIVQRGCAPGDISGCDARALGAFTATAVEAFNLGLVDLRNAEVTGLVDVSVTATFRMDVIGSLLGDVSNLKAGNVQIRNRDLDNGRTVSFTGLLYCDERSGTFFSSVECGETCTGLGPGGSLSCGP